MRSTLIGNPEFPQEAAGITSEDTFVEILGCYGSDPRDLSQRLAIRAVVP